MLPLSVLAIALICTAILSWLRPRIALGALLFLIPFGHLVRFTVAGVPFTFPEAAAYVLALAVLLRVAPSSQPAPTGASGLPAASAIERIGSRLGAGSWRPAARCRDPWIALPLLWILVAAVSAAYSPNALRAWGIWKAYFLGPVLLFWVIRSLWGAHVPVGSPTETQNAKRKTQNDWYFFVFPLAVGALAVASVAILQRWWPVGVPYPWSVPGKFRATSVFGYPNAVGLYLAPLVPLFIGAAFSSWRSLRGARSATKQSRPSQGVRLPRSPVGSLAMTIVFGFSATLSLVAILFARSSGALVALAVAMPMTVALAVGMRRRMGTAHALTADYPISHDREKVDSPGKFPNGTHLEDAGAYGARHRRFMRGGRRFVVAILILWVGASLVLTAWLPNLPERPRWGTPLVQKLTFQKWSGSVRLAQYRETWALLRDHPIRGAGLAGYQQAIAPYHEDDRVEIFLYPHNLLLAVWVELGLAGLLMFLAILYQCFRQFFSPHPDWRGSERGWQYGIIAALLVMLIHGLVDVPYFKNDLAMMFWVIVAMAVVSVVDRQPTSRVR